MSATPALAAIASAAEQFAAAGCPTLAADLRNARIDLAEILDAVADKLDELDARGHGLTDTAADTRLRHAYQQLRPTPCTES